MLLVACLTGYFDLGLTGTGISFAATLPLMSLEFQGEDNLPGVNKAYIIRADEITTEAKPLASPATALERISVVGSHILAEGKYFIKMYSTLGKGTLNFAAEGSRDFENFKVGSTLFYPSTRKEALALSTALLGQDLIIMIEENADSDYFLQIGTKKLPARIVPSGDWGTELNGEKGITFTIEAFHGKCTPYIYDGSILTGAGVDQNPVS